MESNVVVSIICKTYNHAMYIEDALNSFISQFYFCLWYRNKISKVIPEFIIDRAPTAELRENQKDSDSLPEYDILDDILIKILDKKMTYSQIIESGVREEVLDKVWKLLVISEYKRRQSPIGTKVSKSAFLRDINLPVSNGYIWKPMREKDLCQKTNQMSQGIDKE